MQIDKVMEAYAAALRAGDVEALVALYAANGVFTRAEMAPVVGRDALRAAYRQIFSTLKVDLHFKIEDMETADDMAWLRLTSTGRIIDLSKGAASEGLFNVFAILRRESGDWKIRSYSFAPGAR